MSFLMDGARKSQAEGGEGDEAGEDKKPKKLNGGTNGGRPDVGKHAGDVKDQVTKNIDGVQKRVGRTTGGGTNALGTVKGGVGSVTDLT